MIDCSNPDDISQEHQAVHLIGVRCAELMSIMYHMRNAAKLVGLARELEEAGGIVVAMHLQALAKHKKFTGNS